MRTVRRVRAILGFVRNQLRAVVSEDGIHLMKQVLLVLWVVCVGVFDNNSEKGMVFQT